MLSTTTDKESLRQHLDSLMDDIGISCVNGPADTVLSGAREIIDKARGRLESSGIKCVVLNTPYAFHSAQIEPILKNLESLARGVRYMAPIIPLLSPLLGTVVRESGLIAPTYIRKHAREAVDFVAALKAAQNEGLAGENTAWIEIGPKPVCLRMVQKTLGHTRLIHSLRPNESPWTSAAKGLRSLYSYGFDINWNEYHRDFQKSQNLLHIPAYSFDEKNHWLAYKHDWALRKGDDASFQPTKGGIQTKPSTITTTLHALLSEERRESNIVLSFETDLSEPIVHKLISGHKIHGVALCPAVSAYSPFSLT